MAEVTNIAGIIDDAAGLDGARIALHLDDGTACSYRDLLDEVRRWAITLHAAGVCAGDRVAVVDWGGLRSTAVTLAVAHLGAASAQMNPLLTAEELRQLVEVSGCTTVGIACEAATGALAAALASTHGAPGQVLDAHDADRHDADTPAASHPRGRSASAVPDRAVGGHTDAIVLFTSGTTGLPKPVPISHAAFLARIRAYRPPFDPRRPAEVGLMCVPSFHVGGMLGLLVALYGGGTTVIQARFDAGRWLEAVERHRVAFAFVVPTMLSRILAHPSLGTVDVGSLRTVSYGAAAAPVDLIVRAMEAWPHVGFANTFGQTETLGAYTTLGPEDHRDQRRIGSVGRPLPGVSIRVVDPQTGDEVGPDVVGDLWVRSDQNVGGDTSGDGWLDTGDLARVDADGYLYPLGRRSETINRGGEKFAPSEVAGVLRDHRAVEDLVVVGVPDAEMGERVGVALVVGPGAAAPTLEELRAGCAGRLATFKQPELLAVVDALPYNELGKLSRGAAVEMFTTSAPVEPAAADHQKRTGGRR